MTLNQLIQETGLFVGKHKNGSRWIPEQSTWAIVKGNRRILWELEDYRVSSVTGGSIWLVAKEAK